MPETVTPNENRYNKLIVVLSIAIPLAVAVLFGVRIPNVEPLSFLPPIYASINGLTAILLIVAFWAIKNKKVQLHERLMKVCLGFSALFLIMYVAYHMTSDPTPFGGEGTVKMVYYFILVSHILLSIAIIPLVLISFVRALNQRFDRHRKIARITLPIWLYVAITGVVVYLMISPYYTS
jgi:putative membrane protein